MISHQIPVIPNLLKLNYFGEVTAWVLPNIQHLCFMSLKKRVISPLLTSSLRRVFFVPRLCQQRQCRFLSIRDAYLKCSVNSKAFEEAFFCKFFLSGSRKRSQTNSLTATTPMGPFQLCRKYGKGGQKRNFA